jgi:hypothetical protein
MSARELEKSVAELIAKQFDQPRVLLEQTSLLARPKQIERITADCEETARKLRARSPQVLRELISKVEVEPTRIKVALDTDAIASLLGVDLQGGAAPYLLLDLDTRLRRSGKVVRLVQPCGRATGASEPQPHPIRLLGLGRSWWLQMQEEDLSVSELAHRHKVDKSYVTRAVRLNFLAPNLVEQILSGEQPAALNAKRLLGLRALPLSCEAQQQLFAS